MKQTGLSEDEIQELRELLAAERKRAKQHLLAARDLNPEEYRAAFTRFLEILPEGSPLRVESSIPKHRQH